MIKAHRRALKEYEADDVGEERLPMYVHRRTTQLPESTPDRWTTEGVIRHRWNDKGELEFLTKWKGYEETTWEPLKNFFHEYSSDLVSYCQKNNLRLDITKSLSSLPHA